MKKILFLLLLLIFSIGCFSQSVLGIPMGSSFSTVKSQLQNRFGYSAVYDDNGDLIINSDFSMGDFEFNYGSFEFQRSGSSSYFNYAYFEKRFSISDVKSAKNARDYLFSLLKDKYEEEYIGSFINDQGFKCYQFGNDPKDSNRALGIIKLQKTQGKDGKMRLYLQLIYGPIYYIDRSSDF